MFIWLYWCSKFAAFTLFWLISNSRGSRRFGLNNHSRFPRSEKYSPTLLNGCTQSELKDMKKDVGGFMSAEFVAEAFIRLLEEGASGSVMAAWNNVPPYFIPDTGMALFIFYTTCAMICRWIPGVKVVKPWMMVFCAVGIVASWYLGGQFMASMYNYVMG